ncbi:MAG: flavodoxin family protein [Syntrophobacterales bacterium]|nr:flavodoxin family protein [Syntrophobacterales bacterium]
MMRLLAIYGSPRVKGNSDTMMDFFVKGALEAGAKVEPLYVRRLSFKGCIACGHCDEKGVCSQKDDLNSVYPLLMESDIVAIASPNYFYHLPGQLKSLIDRAQALFMAKKLGLFVPDASKRYGFFLGVGATKGKKLFDCSILTVRYFFEAIGVSYGGELCFREIDEKGAILSHPDYLEACFSAGKTLVGKLLL